MLVFIDTCSKLSASECAACNCNSQTSVSTSCSSTGSCKCKGKHYGPKCTDRDCEMTLWSAWSNCRCGYTDKKNRTRAIKTASAGEGLQCVHTKEDGICTMIPCDCDRIKPGYYGDRCEHRHCEMHQWSYWKGCGGCPGKRKRCQDGYCPAKWPTLWPKGYRTRGIKTTKVGKGKECGSQKETDYCGYKCVEKCGSSWVGYLVWNCYYKKY